jgi:hypothetical protein
MHIAFELRGICAVPDGTTTVPGIANHFRLATGQVISIQSIVEMSSDPEADDHRNLGYAETISLGLILQLDDRELSLCPDDP